MKKLIGSLIVLLLLSSCTAGPKIDASSDEALRTSLEEVEAELNPSEKQLFEDSLMTLVLENRNWIKMMDGESAEEIMGALGNFDLEKVEDSLYSELYDDRVKKAIDGKNAEQVIKKADKIKKKRTENPKGYLFDKIRQIGGDLKDL